MALRSQRAEGPQCHQMVDPPDQRLHRPGSFIEKQHEFLRGSQRELEELCCLLGQAAPLGAARLAQADARETQAVGRREAQALRTRARSPPGSSGR
jgi:hypothetical protein